MKIGVRDGIKIKMRIKSELSPILQFSYGLVWSGQGPAILSGHGQVMVGLLLGHGEEGFKNPSHGKFR